MVIAFAAGGIVAAGGGVIAGALASESVYKCCHNHSSPRFVQSASGAFCEKTKEMDGIQILGIAVLSAFLTASLATKGGCVE